MHGCFAVVSPFQGCVHDDDEPRAALAASPQDFPWAVMSRPCGETRSRAAPEPCTAGGGLACTCTEMLGTSALASLWHAKSNGRLASQFFQPDPNEVSSEPPPIYGAMAACCERASAEKLSA